MAKALEFERNLVEELNGTFAKGRDGNILPIRKKKKKARLGIVAEEIFTLEEAVSRFTGNGGPPLAYLRLPVADHSRPSAETASLFVSFYRKLVNETNTGNSAAFPWLHFHCRAGKGRTTTFMAMLDLLSHGGSLERTARRVGAWNPGYNLISYRKDPDPNRERAYVERRAFLEVWAGFAEDVQLNGFRGDWTEWNGEAKVADWLDAYDDAKVAR